jgi:septal ring factor EnvC (AmiA/AmiB activator)
MELFLAFAAAVVALICALAALWLLRRLNKKMDNVSAGLDVVSQTAARSRVASDAAAATLARDQDALWRMRSDVDSVRQDIQAVHARIEDTRKEIALVRRDIESDRTDLGSVHKDIESVRRVLGSLRQDLNDVRKGLEARGSASDPSPLPIPSAARAESAGSVEALREKLKAEQATADPDEDDR